MDEYHLYKVFQAHTQDVKDIVGSNDLITSSRDGAIKKFSEIDGVFIPTFEVPQRKVAVNSLALYPSPISPDKGYLFAGLKDGTIEMYLFAEQSDNKPILVLNGHSANICVLYVDVKEKILMSGGWDSRAVVWSISSMLQRTGGEVERHELTRHKNSVWAVATVPSTPQISFLTGSADRTIKLHNSQYQEIFSFTGHDDVVRSIIVLSPKVFVSTSNDSTLRLWNIESGTCVQKCNSNSGEFAYNLCHVKDDQKEFIVACQEKGYFEVWTIENETRLAPYQIARLPVESIWSVTALQNTDIAFATDKGLVYIYSMDATRKANEELLENFDAQFANMLAQEIEHQKTMHDEVVTIKVSLDDGPPRFELKYTKGTDPALAAEKFITENNLPISYMPEIVEYIKNTVPEARMAGAAKNRQPSAKKTIDGEKYDYAFEVTLENNAPPVFLGYNIGEDPDLAAQRFVEKHHLNMGIMQKLSALLRSEVPELNQFRRIGNGNSITSLPSSSSSNFADPLTGTGRYIPPSTNSSNSSANFTDPLTGQGRYVPTNCGVGNKILDKKRPRGEFVPLKSFFEFGLENASVKTIPKLIEMNNMQLSEQKLNQQQLDALKQVMNGEEVTVHKDLYMALQKGLDWSIETIVPVLDVFRIALLIPHVNEHFCSPTINSETNSPTLRRLIALLVSDPPDAVRILICRAFANAAVHKWGQKMLMSDITTITNAIVTQLSIVKPNLQLAASSAIANLAFLLLKETEEEGGCAELGPREDTLRSILIIQDQYKDISFGAYPSEAVLRLLQAISTLIWGDPTIIKLAKNRGLNIMLSRIKDSVSDERVKSLTRDTVEMLFDV